MTRAHRFAQACCCALLLLLSVARAEARQELSIWSAYSGREEVGLRDAVAAFQRRRPDLDVKLLSIPFGAYLAKLEAAIPTGNGPDLFVDSHERMPELATRDLLEPWPCPALARSQFAKPHLDVLSDRGQLLGLPLALKSLALYVNTALVPDPVVTTARLRQLRATLPVGTYPLVFEAENPYYAAAVLHAPGGSLLSKNGEYAFIGEPAERTLENLWNDWTRSRTIPEAPSGDLVKRLFATGKAATAISGPWLATDLPATLQFRVEPLPALTEAGGNSLLPFVTIEAVSGLPATRRAAQDAFALAAFLAGEEGAQIRAQNGGQVVALAAVRSKISEAATGRFRARRRYRHPDAGVSADARCLGASGARIAERVARRSSSQARTEKCRRNVRAQHARGARAHQTGVALGSAQPRGAMGSREALQGLP